MTDHAIPQIRIEDYGYPLPDERIAKYPLPRRDSSKLLRYKDGSVDEWVFRDLPSLLPGGSVMVFNDTKVVPARLHFVKPTGAHIEIFCLEPVEPCEYNLSFATSGSCTWKCVLGNVKRWKEGSLLLANPASDSVVAGLDLRADLLSRDGRTGVVKFEWKGGIPFSRVLEICGTIPIPPYLGRESEAIDVDRYQTLYAKVRGSVAAPTAGLHFTEDVLDGIARRGIDIRKVCLHVGAGTFLPVKTSLVSEHPMHREPFSVDRALVERLAAGCTTIAVGTTSVRTLESLYYCGVSILRTGTCDCVQQWAPYVEDYPFSTEEALRAILDYMDSRGEDTFSTGTRIIIVPSFRFRIVDALVTNFHQPESTLILLVSAFVEGDWRKIYAYALEHDFRFLSYGDSSLLFRPRHS